MAPTVTRFLARALFALAALIFLASLVLVGAALSIGWLVWNLARGRRPSLPRFNLGTTAGAMWPGAGQTMTSPWRMAPFPRRSGRSTRPMEDVIEGEARETRPAS